MTEKIDWDNLPTTIKVWEENTKQLIPGLYACPRCEGTGRVQVGHADPGPNPTVKCGMCMCTKMIKKCGECQENPVPSNSILGLCKECEDNLMQHILDLEKHIEIVCTFQEESETCGHPELQESNSNGKLVCDIKGCEYATLPPTSDEKENINMETKTEDIRKEHKTEFDEEERLYQAERQLEMTKNIMKGEHVEEPCV
ncbi:MAG: hypothetical protein KAS66_01935 [Candidatus Omnitrophica bacterium]|nr:hypothetical protein [Candidatus Omnitrophota bacterium]